MKKILNYFCASELPLLREVVISSTNKCSWYKIEEEGIFQKSSNSENWELCEVFFEITRLDETFYKYVISTIKKAHFLVPYIKTSDPNESQTYGVKVDGKIEGVVYSIIEKVSYEDQDNGNIGIFDFMATLLYRIVKSHAFYNGNKRTAILTIAYLLNALGYYIVWSSDSEAYMVAWEEFMMEIVSSNNEEEQMTAKIKEKLVKATWMKL